MTNKTFLSAQQLLEDAFRLGADVAASEFRPTLLVAIWRGGMPIGVAVHEILAYAGIQTDHIAVRTSSYRGIDERSDEVRIEGMEYLLGKVRREDSLLIVDDVFDTGRTVTALIEHLERRTGPDMPGDVPGVPSIGPAVANAVAAATGRRVRALPMSKSLGS